MNQHRLTLFEPDEEDEGFEIELDWFTPRPPWYKRLWYWLTRKQPPEEDFTLTEEEEQEVEDEFNKRLAVAECIEAALASNVWVNHDLENEMPGMHRYYVVGMGVHTQDDGEFRLYVRVQPKHGYEAFFMPLHEFLTQCYPLGGLSFTDLHS